MRPSLIAFILFISISFAGIYAQEFSFAYFTDIHLSLNNELGFQGFTKALNHAEENGAALILTGGDNVDIDVLGDDLETAEKLYGKFSQQLSNSSLPVYPTLGNHDRFMGRKNSSEIYNEGLFEKYLGKSYYSFDFKGWHFIVLNSTQSGPDGYCVGEAQLNWLKEDVGKLDPETPIIISAHVPFLSVYYPALKGKYTDTDTFSNFKQVWDVFNGYKLKLVLQGHMHLYEEIYVKGVQFITGGAISASWWGGPYYGTEEGYLRVNISGDSFTWDYVDYGWEATQDIH
jgi:3',5'-cyclic AMP phosphodiesterase CpdA